MIRYLVPLFAIGALMLGILLAISTLRPDAAGELQGGVLLSEPRPIRDFQLVDQSGKTFTQADLQGQWTAIFPGFTNCPDICPTTLGVLRTAAEQLADAGRDWEIVFLTVDPQRDTPEALAQYVGYFSQDFVGLTGDKDGIGQLARDLSIAYQYTPTGDDSYTVDHTAAIVLVDPQGRVAGFLQPPFAPERLAADLRTAGASQS